MQKLPVYLYTNLFDVLLDLDNNKGIHRIMYQRPLKIQKGVKNTVQLQFKNSDQKLLDISSYDFEMNIFDNVDHTLLMKKTIEVIDDGETRALRGLASVTLTENDTIDIDSKQYSFSIVQVNADGTYSQTYSNTYYDVAGVLEIKNDVYPLLKPSQEINNFQRNYNADLDKRQWEYDTGNINAHPEFNSNVALHTVAFYMNSYKGQVIVEGTLENSPSPTYAHYANISTKSFNGYSGIDYVNFNGIFNHIRVRYIPAKNPNTQQNDDTEYAGTLDKVLYRS